MGFFKKGEREEPEQNEYEKLLRRVNTLEVRLSRLLKMEDKLGPLLTLKDRFETKRMQEPNENKQKIRLMEDQINKQNAEIDRMKQIIHSFIKENNQIAMEDQIKKQNAEIDRMKRIIHSLMEEKNQRSDVMESESSSQIDSQMADLYKKYTMLETSLTLVNQMQISIIHSLEATQEEIAVIQKGVDSETQSKAQFVTKDIYIDKFFLEKYELNNNIGTVGIKDLGGALNIGATYGSVPLPGNTASSSLGDQEEENEALKEEEVESSAVEIPIDDTSESDS
ncbi:hypothetical protein [Neobacillus terrae]|uniref:hypothetical protein n=1 Tax=Neobacillus terrae TaxID=3034837 RepID=UPI00140734C1|nr:hypothetical protein [Neobacillus terrae]NHM33075.1 hypothetical protein [Neobacillus terrae]